MFSLSGCCPSSGQLCTSIGNSRLSDSLVKRSPYVWVAMSAAADVAKLVPKQANLVQQTLSSTSYHTSIQPWS